MGFVQSDFFIQAIGFIGLLMTFLSFQSNKHKNVVAIKVCSVFVFAVQYYLKGAYTGCILNFLGGVRNLTYLEIEKKGKSTKAAVWVFLVIFTVAAFLTSSADGIMFIFPLVGKLLSTVAYSLKDARKIRLLNIPTAVLWMFYNISNGMWAAIIADSVTLCSVLIAEVRFDLIPYAKKKKLTK